MIFKFLIKLFNSYLLNKNENTKVDSVVLRSKYRQLSHKDLPSLNDIKLKAGRKFYDLQEILNYYDPIVSKDLRDFPNKYESITRTIIYRLPEKRTRESVSSLIYVEFSLWFNHEYNDFQRKEELTDAVFLFKRKNLIPNPFQTEGE